MTPQPIDSVLLPVLERIQIATGDVFPRVFGRLRVELVKGVDNLKSIDKDRPKRLPMYWSAKDNSNKPVMPDEKQGGMLFAVSTASTKIVDSEPGWAKLSGVQTKVYQLAIIAWWDTKNQLLDRDAIQCAIEEELGSCYAWLTTSIDDQLATRVFRDIDYETDNYPYLMYPYAGLRIEGELTITESICQ